MKNPYSYENLTDVGRPIDRLPEETCAYRGRDFGLRGNCVVDNEDEETETSMMG